jgi:flagellar biosynthetic protein FlhB
VADDAGERTEAATPRRRQRAREGGQAALSPEASGFAVLAATAALVVVFAPAAARTLVTRLAGLMDLEHAAGPAAAMRAAGLATALAAGPFLLASLVAGTLAVLGQTGGLLYLGAIKPDLARLDPRRGLSRIASPTALLEAGKSLLKLAVAGFAVWTVLKASVPRLTEALFWAPATLVERTSHQVLHILMTLLVAQGLLAGADIVRARMKHASGLRMTRQEVRDEHKESDGDPHIKARIRRLRMQRARRRMLAAVPKAVVVVTNPTHYAIALAYERNSAGAPRVVAKGVDAMAERIRAVAREHRVPLVANPPLARALYPSQLDAEIPRELFQAVAEVIAYVWRLRARAR